MKSKVFEDFFLVSPKEPNTDNNDEIVPMNEEFIQVQPIPVIFNSRKCLRDRREKEIKFMTVNEWRKAA